VRKLILVSGLALASLLPLTASAGPDFSYSKSHEYYGTPYSSHWQHQKFDGRHFERRDFKHSRFDGRHFDHRHSDRNDFNHRWHGRKDYDRRDHDRHDHDWRR
jgi:hypothetical protein